MRRSGTTPEESFLPRDFQRIERSKYVRLTFDADDEEAVDPPHFHTSTRRRKHNEDVGGSAPIRVTVTMRWRDSLRA